jgi:hypothetical protein
MQHEGRIRASALDWASLVLVIVGAINWGLVGIGQFIDANWNVVNVAFGSIPELEAAIYLLVGLAGIYELYFAYQLYTANRPEQTMKKEAA